LLPPPRRILAVTFPDATPATVLGPTYLIPHRYLHVYHHCCYLNAFLLGWVAATVSNLAVALTRKEEGRREEEEGVAKDWFWRVSFCGKW